MKKIVHWYPVTAAVFILLFCIAGVLLNGCSKKDQTERQTAEITPPSTFFTVPSSTDPLVTAIVNSLQRQDKKGTIELQLSRHAGVPKWDKTMVSVTANTNAGKGENGLTDSVKVILIPFVWKDKKQTHAMLRVKISSIDTSYQLIYAGQYPEFGFEKKEKGKWNALNLFHLFTRFDNSIFGHKKFLVKDKRLLAGLGASEQGTAIVELKGERTVAAKLIAVTYCNDYDVCLKPCKAFRLEIESFSESLSQTCCIEWGTSSVCTQIWIDDGDPAPAPGTDPEPTPGTGGTGGGTPIADPCRLDPNLFKLDPRCFDLDPGWVPTFDNIYNEVTDPCIRNMVDQVINRNCQNQITTFINSTFGENPAMDITFVDEPLGNMLIGDGLTAGHLGGSGKCYIRVTLNNSPGSLPGASQEYVAATILHEVIHGWIILLNTARNSSNEISHETMTSSANINKLANALKEMYPALSLQDCIDLAWGGLQKTNGWNALSQADKDRINQTNFDYKNATKGTKCNP